MLTYSIYLMIIMGVMTLWVNLYHLWPDFAQIAMRAVHIVSACSRTTARPVHQHVYHYANRRH